MTRAERVALVVLDASMRGLGLLLCRWVALAWPPRGADWWFAALIDLAAVVGLCGLVVASTFVIRRRW